MTQNEIDKINRFTERVPPYLADHWNEIIDILQENVNEKYISQLEMDNFELINLLNKNRVKKIDNLMLANNLASLTIRHYAKKSNE